MSLSVNSVWEVRAGGSDTNGGGFVTGAAGTDFSQQNSANSSGNNISTTNAVAVGSSTLTSITASFTSAIVGNIIFLSGGTGSLASGWYQVTAFTNSTTITVDRTVATGTGITMNIGGALLSLGILFTAGFSGAHIAFVQQGTFSVSSSTVNTTGGPFSAGVVGSIVGYNTNRNVNNTDIGPTFNYATSGITMFVTRGIVANITLNGNSQTTANVAGATDISTFLNCTFNRMNVLNGTGGNFIKCGASLNSAAIFTNTAVNCEAFSNTATPYTLGKYYNCLSYNNTGSTTDGFNMGTAESVAKNCISYGNGRDGFGFVGTPRPSLCINCHSENNTGWGFNFSSLSQNLLINCSAYNNVSGTFSSATKNTIINFVAVTAGSVFVNAAGANFALNNTTNQGNLLRATGSPSAFPAGTTLAFIDIGASQHQDPTGGSGVVTFASTFS